MNQAACRHRNSFVQMVMANDPKNFQLKSTEQVLMQNRRYRKSTSFCSKPILFVVVLFLPVLAMKLQAQPCQNKIENNFIEASPAVCVNTLAWLHGSTPRGGNGSYNYQWEIAKGNCGDSHFEPIAGATGQDYMVPTNAAPNSCYRRVVTSGNCTDNSNKIKVDAQVVVNPIPPLITVVNPTCMVPTGTITVSRPGPGPGISYSIDGINYANTSGVFSGLVPNTYNVTVRYPTGCTSPISVIAVKPLPVLTGSITPAADTLCGTGTSIKLTVNGGATYQWYLDGAKINGATSAGYQATQAGTYTAEIFDGSCKGKAQNKAVITQGTVPTGSITPSQVVLCGAGSSANLTVNGNGTSYQWYRNGIKIAGATNAVYQATQAGSYMAELANSTCQGKTQNNAVVTEGVVPSGSITPASAALCGSGSSVNLTINGGSSYQWYRDGVKITEATGASYLATQAGEYTAEIFNATCKGKAQNKAIIIQGTVPAGSIAPSNATLCGGGGSVKLTAGGGTSYQWYRNGAKINGATGAVYQATQTGTYTADIFNATCSSKTQNSAVVNQNPSIAFSVSTTEPNCTSAFGEIKLQNVSGGSGNGFQYSKDNGQTFQQENTFSHLSPGTYQMVVKDNLGCTSNAVTAVIHSFVSTLKATTTATKITCTQSSASVTIAASGGTPPYQYSVDGLALQTSNVVNGLVAGNHKAQVKDAAGCIFEASFIVVVVNSTLNGTVTVTHATCTQNGAVTAKPTGGAPPYTYSLDGGAYQSSGAFGNLSVAAHKLTIKDAAGCMFLIGFDVKQTGTYPKLVVKDTIIVCPGNTVDLTLPAVVNGSDANLLYSYWKDTTASTPVTNPAAVAAGNYFIKAVNNQGCAAIKRIVVWQHTPPEGKIILSGPAIVCFGQTVTLTATNGKAYQWYLNDAPINAATDAVYKAAVAGAYSVAINDGVCTAAASNTVQVQFTSCTSLPESSVAVPTAFTPNKNGANDVLRPLLRNIASLQYFKVYNRWGQEVFRTSEMGKGWDGTINGVPQPTETYTWLLQCTDNNGNIIKQSGRSLLIR